MTTIPFEKLRQIAKETLGFDDIELDGQLTIAFRAIEAEVLRLNGWQPIETAPRDGTSVLIYMPEASRKKVMEAYWGTPWEGAPEDQCWWTTPHGPAGRGYTILPKAVTHWMRLPAAPGDHIADSSKSFKPVTIQEAPYDRCQKHLREAGKAYPRTCSVCGLWGPCQFEPQTHRALEALANTFHEGRAGCVSPGAEGYVSAALQAAEDAISTPPRATGCPDALPESFASVGANGETLGATVQSLRRDLEQWEQNEFSRAMGCPDTMDDTAQYAVDQKTAGEEKSPPATGPAG